MRLRRHQDEPAMAAADQGGMPAPPPHAGQPSSRDINSIGVAIMPGIPLPDWVTAASLEHHAAGPPVSPPAAAVAPAPVAAAAVSSPPPAMPAFPQVDPAYEALLAKPLPVPSNAEMLPAQPVAVPEQAAARVEAPAYPQVLPAYDAAFAAPVPVAGPGATTGTALPPPDPAQWSEQPIGTVVWGPVQAQPAPTPALAMPAQARAGDTAMPMPTPEQLLPAVAAPAPATTTTSAVPPFAFTPAPPSGPAFPPATPADPDGPASPVAFDAADLEAPDLAAPPFDDERSEPEAAETESEAADAELDPFGAVLPPVTPAETTQTPRWFLTDEDDAAETSAAADGHGSGAGQYGWLFQPDDPAARSEPAPPARTPAGAAPAWFDPSDTAAPSEAPNDGGAPQPAESWFSPGFDWMTTPDEAPAAQSPGAEAVDVAQVAVAEATVAENPPLVPSNETSAAPDWAVTAQPSFGPPPFGQTPVTVDEPVAAAARAEAPVADRAASAEPVPSPVFAAVPAAPPAPLPVSEPLPAPQPVATAEEPPAPPAAEATGAAPKRRGLWLALIAGLVVAALAAVAAFVYPGFLKSEPAVVSAPPTIVTPTTAANLTRTAQVAPVAAAFRRTAVAAGAAESSQYATYRGAGTLATVWDSNGGSASPAQTAKAFTEAGGPKLGPLVNVPPGPRGGTMACAAVDATRSVCFWNADGVLGGADLRGLGRSEAGVLAGQLRVDLEQPAA